MRTDIGWLDKSQSFLNLIQQSSKNKPLALQIKAIKGTSRSEVQAPLIELISMLERTSLTKQIYQKEKQDG